MDDLSAALLLSYCAGFGNNFLVDLFRRGHRPSRIVVDSGLWPAGINLVENLPSLSARVIQARTCLNRLDARLLLLGDADYPALLARIPDPPALLFVRGSPHVLDLPQVALIGSRKASRAGLHDAYDLAGELARGGFLITSGLARGIDAAGHRGALDVGGRTIAVMGTGLDQVYPAEHSALANQLLAEGGALVSEFPPGTPPRRENFPRRNRVISGLSASVVVVEAEAESGTLITARFAAEQGRSLCAMPGGIRDPLKAGCHRLIREGATLVVSAAEVAESASSLLGAMVGQLDSGVRRDNVQRRSAHPLLAYMGADPLSFEQLLFRSGLTPGELATQLGELELAGIIYPSPQGFRRSP